jgi:hypothetical protein
LCFPAPDGPDEPDEPDGERHPINQLRCILRNVTCLLSQPVLIVLPPRRSPYLLHATIAQNLLWSFCCVVTVSCAQVNIYCVQLRVPNSSSDTSLTCLPAWRCTALTDWDTLLTLLSLPVTPVCRSAHPYSSISTIMSLTSNPLSSGGPSSVSASRTQNLKRSVQAAFEGKNYIDSFALSLHEINPLVTRLITSFCTYPLNIPQRRRNINSTSQPLSYHITSPASPCFPRENLFLFIVGRFPFLTDIPMLTSLPEPTDRGTNQNVGYQSKVRIIDRYSIIGFISSGTYGRVYKARSREDAPGLFAIKKFKPGNSFPHPAPSSSCLQNL